jgi:hypothetical protein
MSWLERQLRALGLGEVIAPFLFFGALFVAAGLAVPGTQSGTATVVVSFGCFLFTIGLLGPRYRKVRLPGGSEIEAGERQAPTPWLEAEKKTLLRVARLMLNDDIKRAKQTVKRTLGKVRRYRSQTDLGNHDATVFRTLVEMLRRVDERRWFDGLRQTIEPEGGVEALQLVEFDRRIAYVLSQQMRAPEVAQILERPLLEVENEIRLCREQIAPYIDPTGGTHV